MSGEKKAESKQTKEFAPCETLYVKNLNERVKLDGSSSTIKT